MEACLPRGDIKRNARSELYSLPPIGVGTALGESLTSYLVRLANVHCLTPYHLISSVLRKTQRPECLREIFWSLYIPTINGLSHSAAWWSHRLDFLTGQDELKFLTMLPWSAVFTPRDLLRHSKAWCQICYSLWREHNTPIYDPLLWAIKLVQICPIHHIALCCRCPHDRCRKEVPVVSPLSQPGYCGTCQGWLGYSPDRRGSVHTNPVDPVQVATATAVAEMIMYAPVMTGDPQVWLNKTTKIYVQVVARNNLCSLARMSAISESTLQQWITNRRKTSLGKIVTFCHAMKTTPLRILTGVDYTFYAT